MRQDEINKDLGSYIHDRKSRPLWKKFNNVKIKPKHDADVEAAVKHDIERMAAHEEQKMPAQHKHELEELEAKAVNDAEIKIEDAVEKEHENVLHKFFKKLNFSRKEEDESRQIGHMDMSDNPEISMDDEEMRELLHGLHNWIIQLPSDKLERFKTSREFELYTKYLRKHNLIK